MRFRHVPVLVLVLAAVALTPAPTVLGGSAAAQAVELGWGANVTSNYIFRGATQSDDDPALQGYVEGAFRLFYLGAWASTVDFDADERFELNLYGGVRPSLGDLALDVGYIRYLYDDGGDCCGELALQASYPIADLGEVGGAFYYDPDEDASWTEARAAYYFAEVWEIGGSVGSDLGSLDVGDDDKTAWDIGIGRTLGDLGAVDLRWHDSNYDDGAAVVSIGVDF